MSTAAEETAIVSEPEPASELAVECVHCSTPLDLHQPDREAPERLLGTCPECGLWHLVHVQAVSRVSARGVVPLRAG